MCDDRRQEWILLSDTLGVSMLLETINHRARDGRTEATVLGPFHVEGVGVEEMGFDICRDGKGEPCVVSGRVADAGGRPIEGAVLDVWQTNGDGRYDVQQPDEQPEHNMRGKFVTGADGRYWFRTTKPVSYPVPTDGPVGADAGCHRAPRPAARPHSLHRDRGGLRAGGGPTSLVRGDPWIDSDAVFGGEGVADRPPSNSRRNAGQAREAGVHAPFWTAEFDFALAETPAG